MAIRTCWGVNFSELQVLNAAAMCTINFFLIRQFLIKLLRWTKYYIIFFVVNIQRHYNSTMYDGMSEILHFTNRSLIKTVFITSVHHFYILKLLYIKLKSIK